MENSGNRNEIDLLLAFDKIREQINLFFKWITRLVVLFVCFLIKYIYVYVLSMLLCALGIYINNHTYNKPVYSSTLIATSNIVSNTDIVVLINNLRKILNEGNLTYVASELNCSVYDAVRIKDIEALYEIDTNNDGIADFIDYEHKLDSKTNKDSSMEVLPSEFAIKLNYSDTSIIKKVRKGIINYLHRNKYIKERDSLNRKQLFALITKTNEEILQLDTLQTNYNKYITKNSYGGQDLKSQLLMVNDKDVKLLYKDALKLFAEKQSLEQRYELITKGIVSVKTDFVPSMSPINRTIKHYVFFLIFIPWGLIIFIHGLRNRVKVIKTFTNFKREILSDF